MTVTASDTVPVRASVRFPLRLEVAFSTPSGDFRAVTENVSANGLLFVADHLPAVGTPVEFHLTMPAAIMGGADDVSLHCFGRIVRHGGTPDRPTAAAVINEYSLKAEH